MKNVLYHYTTFGYLEEILNSRFLKVSPWEKKNKIKRPALWLTKNPNWDNTATKGYYDRETGERRSLTFEEQSTIFGCIRITIPFKNTFCNWRKFKHVSKEPIELCNQLEIIGRKQGSNPDDWYVSFDDVAATEIIAVDYWDGKEWVDISIDEDESITNSETGDILNINQNG